MDWLVFIIFRLDSGINFMILSGDMHTPSLFRWMISWCDVPLWKIILDILYERADKYLFLTRATTDVARAMEFRLVNISMSVSPKSIPQAPLMQMFHTGQLTAISLTNKLLLNATSWSIEQPFNTVSEEQYSLNSLLKTPQSDFRISGFRSWCVKVELATVFQFVSAMFFTRWIVSSSIGIWALQIRHAVKERKQKYVFAKLPVPANWLIFYRTLMENYEGRKQNCIGCMQALPPPIFCPTPRRTCMQTTWS